MPPPSPNAAVAQGQSSPLVSGRPRFDSERWLHGEVSAAGRGRPAVTRLPKGRAVRLSLSPPRPYISMVESAADNREIPGQYRVGVPISPR